MAPEEEFPRREKRRSVKLVQRSLEGLEMSGSPMDAGERSQSDAVPGGEIRAPQRNLSVAKHELAERSSELGHEGRTLIRTI